jgi:adenine specific DNA methylase Mod
LAEAIRKDSVRLIWNTKPRRAINPKDIEFQTAEAVLPNPSRDQQTIQSFFNTISNVHLEKSKMNRLIWGDNLLAMQALLASGYEGKIGMIYIDPSFWTNENYYAKFEIEDREITKLPSVIERLAYKDIWEGGIDSFLDMLYPRLQLMRRLLADNGSIFVHFVLSEGIFKANSGLGFGMLIPLCRELRNRMIERFDNLVKPR